MCFYTSVGILQAPVIAYFHNRGETRAGIAYM